MWWREAVVYQIYPRSFADASGDGVGDLDGLRGRLEYLQWLGVDAIWLSPIYRSPMADFGYDVADYCDIDPLFGDLATFDALLEEAHARDLCVLLDWVPNHTSDQHPWFVESRSSRSSAKRSWYRWRDGSPDAPPNNWPAAFGGGSAWTWDERTEQWYLHTFLPEQPDLNWDEPAVIAAMHDVLRFWLERGVDGFRADVVHLIGKDPALPDLAQIDATAGHLTVVGVHDYPGTHALLRGIRSVLEEYPGERMMVGEVNLSETSLIAPYLGEDDELHLAFDFESLFVPWEAGAWGARILDVESIMGERWPTWVFSNHDQPRIRTRLGGSEARARAALVMVLTLRGTPFLYAGEELGLEDATVPPERVVDPGGRDGCRAPIPWTEGDGHGWPVEPWLPWPPEAAERSVEGQRADGSSFLHLARVMLAVRRASAALRSGSLQLLDDAPSGVLAYERAAREDHRRVWINFGPGEVELPGGWDAELRTDQAAQGEANAPLAADAAAVLRPR
jgi:alpha-glucosidase